MFGKLFDSNEKQINKIQPLVDKINSYAEDFEKLSDEQIKEKTKKWQSDLQDIRGDIKASTVDPQTLEKINSKQDEYLDKILPEAYALVREASRRTMGMRHYDVQLIAGIVLHQGKISEQKTGEGKTLTATLPLYLNSLTGRGVHLVAPNEYLAMHGAGWMGTVYDALGLTTGLVMSDEKSYVYDPNFESSEFSDPYAKHLKPVERQVVYQQDVTYGTNHEFGFDYLRDNMARSLTSIVQTNKNGDWGSHNFAIVDEVDSILIDVARTPLIISGMGGKTSERYHEANDIVAQLIKDTDYEVDEKFRSATLSDFGVRKVEKLVGAGNLYEEDFEMVHLLEQALIAHTLYEKDKEYIVRNGQVLIIDQFTGRILESNRFSNGLHQAIEAKEDVPIQQENVTKAAISYQNYFKKYNKLAGMTGTAVTEAEEFYKMYDLDVVVIPTNRPIARIDHNDVVYKTEAGKFKAVADEIAEVHESGQPVLVGTTSVEKSQLLYSFLKRKKINAQILNAKNHEQEALIIAQAGKKGAITISTNMAGRGVDIILGGDPSTSEEREEIRALGGLHVIGTERHESRRIDNQLRGRSGRQGDPGSSRFFVSLQDHLMKVFGGAAVERIMDRMGLDDSIPLEAGLVSKAIQNAQKKVEGFNFDSRKQVVEYDDVLNVHREVIYRLRRRILEMSEGENTHKEWFLGKVVDNSSVDIDVEDTWFKKESELGEADWMRLVGSGALQVVDELWQEHLVDMDHLRTGIGVRAYAQKDPLVEYKREGHERFDILIAQVYANIAGVIKGASEITAEELQLRREAYEARIAAAQAALEAEQAKMQFQHGELNVGVEDEAKAFVAGQVVGGRGSSGGRAVAGGAGNSRGAGNPDLLSQPAMRDRDGRLIRVQKVGSKSGSRGVNGVKGAPVSGGLDFSNVGRNDPCPCGSGKKFKKCHGA